MRPHAESGTTAAESLKTRRLETLYRYGHCRGKRKDGHPCQSPAAQSGYCVTHDPERAGQAATQRQRAVLAMAAAQAAATDDRNAECGYPAGEAPLDHMALARAIAARLSTACSRSPGPAEITAYAALARVQLAVLDRLGLDKPRTVKDLTDEELGAELERLRSAAGKPC